MGYIDKTVSKNEVLIKQARISALSFMDRYIAAVLYILGGLFILIDTLFIHIEPVTVGEQKVDIATVVTAAVGALIIVLILLLAIYKLVQKITQADKDAMLPSSVFGRYAFFGLTGIVVALIAVIAGQPNQAFDIVEGIFCIIFGGLIMLFSILRYKAIKLVVTDKRVFGKRNIWRTESFDLPIAKIDNVVIVFSFWGKMFNYATVTVKSVMGEYKFKYVKSSEEFKNLIMDMVSETSTEDKKAV